MPYDKRSDGGRGQNPPRRSNPPKYPVPPSRERRDGDVGDKPAYDRKPAFGDKPRYGDKPSYDRKPAFGDKPRYGDKPAYDRKPAFGDKPRYGDKPAYDRKPAFGDKPRYGDKPAYDRKPAFGDKPRYGTKPGYGDRPARNEERPPRVYKPHYDDKPSYGDKPRFEDRPPRRFDDKPSYGDKPRFEDRPPRRFDDKPRFDDTREVAENLIAGRNPIREALKAGQSFEKLLVAEGELTGSAREILALARENGVVVQYVDRRGLDQLYPNHQGMVGYISAAEYSTVDDIFSLAKERGEDVLVVVLDGITDPHNLGAIARSAECMGAHGIIIPQRRSVGLTPAAVKAAAGAFSYIKVVREVNLNRALEELKQRGVWITGSVMDGTPIDKCNLTGPMALVVGAEEDGISQLVKKNCDQLATIPMSGRISSLNASVAAGLLLYEISRARRG